MSTTQLTQTRHVSELETTIKELQHALANEKQKNYGKDYVIKTMKTKLDKVERDCKHIEAAFESYVNEVELEKLRDKIQQDMDKLYDDAVNTTDNAA